MRQYFADIRRAITSTFEGLTVTSSWFFRRPMTIQYPDRIEKPVQEMLPENYRGLLEVDLRRCIGCGLCMKTCPINAVQMKVEKNPETGVREIVQFDIDIGRCMYCGLCSETCKYDALRHTPDFEAVSCSPDGLVLRFAKPPVPVAKFKVGEGPPRRPLGSILAETVPPCFRRIRWRGKGEGQGSSSFVVRSSTGQPGDAPTCADPAAPPSTPTCADPETKNEERKTKDGSCPPEAS